LKRLQITIEYITLPNGLKVVIAPDHSAPVTTVGVYYKVGFRMDPPGRGGFAHLLEHMMFQGSANAPREQHLKLIHASGGRSNGSTGCDWTNYFESVPSNALCRVLWLEADRMRALKLNEGNLKTQRDVIKEEVRRNVLNQPYGGFPVLDMPAIAFRNWANAHTCYGDFADLDAIDLKDLETFFKTYYVPNNAVLLMLGDVKPQDGLALAEQYFGSIPAGTALPSFDPSEPEQTQERRGYIEEKIGALPSLAVGYLMPERRTSDWCAMALLDQELHYGRAGRIHRELVEKRQIALEAWGGIDDFFGYNGPNQLITCLRFRPEYPSESALLAFDAVIRGVQEVGLTTDELNQLLVKWQADFYARLDDGGPYMPKYGLMHLLACFALFDDQPHLVNTILDEFLAVTGEQTMTVAQKYLRNENRAIVFRAPAKAAAKEVA